jgi:hypothetical protein
MPPTPKPPGTRRRNGPSQGQWKNLPAAKDFKRPELPKRSPAWLPSTKQWWATLWDSPMATVYMESDVKPLIRLAELIEQQDRGDGAVAALAQITALEDRYGLSPKARRALQWEVDQAEKAEVADLANVPKLKAVK